MSRVSFLLVLPAIAMVSGCTANEPPQTAKSVPAHAEVRPAPPSALQARIRQLGDRFPGQVGIAVRDVDAGWTAEWQGERLMPQQSVSKLWVALTVLDAVDRRKMRLEDPVVVTRDDLSVFHQPLRRLVDDDGYPTTVADLLDDAITESDNAANNTLMNRVGGPWAVRKTLTAKKLGDIRFGPGENFLQASIAGLTWRPEFSYGMSFKEARAALPDAYRRERLDTYVDDPMDGAAPAAVVEALARLKRGELLSPQSTQRLLQTMAESRTGPKRLRGGLAPGWSIAHKTGTGQDLGAITTGYNDVAILTAPDGRSYAVAVMIGKTTQGIPARWALMSEVTRTVVAHHEGRLGGGAPIRNAG